MTEPVVDWGVAQAALGGHPKSGDCHLIMPFSGGVLVAAMDGIGHGDEACRAAETAAGILAARAGDNIIALLKRCHEALRGTRGAVMSLASFSAEGVMTWSGVGNVEGLLLRADHAGPPRESLLLRAGVVGRQLPALQASVVPVTAGDTLIFTTDGIRGGFNSIAPLMHHPPQQIADQILARDSKGTDDALVLVARYLGREPKES
jgi:hypothetical protein